VKVARTVWSRGKAGDNFKGLPIAIDIVISARRFDKTMVVFSIYDVDISTFTTWLEYLQCYTGKYDVGDDNVVYMTFNEQLINSITLHG